MPLSSRTYTDVVKYWFGINADPSSAHSVTTSGGAAVTVKFMPTKPGVNYVTAQAFDAAGNGSQMSQISRYQFRVRAGQPQRLSLGLDEQAGASSISGTGGAWAADLHGGTQAGGAGITGTGLHLDGVDGYASTVSPVLNTGKSFSVSVWAKLPAAQPSLPLMALSQNGQYTSGFQLYYSATSGGWVFARFTSDNQAGQGFVKAAQPSCATGDTACTAGRLGTWTHVAGVFDNPDGLLTLYVNGSLVATAPFSSPWDARGQTMIGANTQNGTLNADIPQTVAAAAVDVRRQADESIASAVAVAATTLGDTLGEIIEPDQGKLRLVALGQPLTRPNRVAAYNAERDKLWAALEKSGVALPRGSRTEIDVAHSDDALQFGGGIEFMATELSVALEVTRLRNAVCVGQISEPDGSGWERFLSSLEPLPKDSVALLRAAVRQIAHGLFVARSFGQFDDAVVGVEVFAENDVVDQLEAAWRSVDEGGSAARVGRGSSDPGPVRRIRDRGAGPGPRQRGGDNHR